MFGVAREAEGLHDIERFSFDPVQTAMQGKMTGEPCYVLFSYENREVIYGGAVTKSTNQVE